MIRFHTAPASPSRFGLGLLSVCCFLLSGCWQLPIRQHLHLAFQSDGALRLTLLVELDSSATSDRLQEQRDMLLRGETEWQARFEALRPDLEDLSWTKAQGELRRYQRSALVGRDPLLDGALARFWSDTPVFSTFSYDAEAGRSELAFFPGSADRATRSDRRRVEQALKQWSKDLKVYFETMEAFYGYLEERPDRAQACFSEMFDAESDDLPLTEEEELLIDAVGEAMAGTIYILDASAREDDDGRIRDEESLEEVSRRVFDPFGVEVSVELPGDALEREGFERRGDRWIVPGMSLWSALRQLDGRWVTPDPLLMLVEAELVHAETEDNSNQAVDVPSLAAQPRRVELPLSATEIEQALREALEPADIYRLAWLTEVATETATLD